MPELISDGLFLEKFSSLSSGDIAYHAMLFPGVYPPDRALHDRALQGAPYEPQSPFFDITRRATENGARFQRLRVLPKAGEFGYGDDDIAVMRRLMGAVASFGFDVRAVYYSDHAQRIFNICGEDSPVVQDFRRGLEHGDPRKSSWAIYKRAAGRLALTYLDTMDYEKGIFTGHMQHTPPIDEHIVRWTDAWRETFEKFGEPITPLSS